MIFIGLEPPNTRFWLDVSLLFDGFDVMRDFDWYFSTVRWVPLTVCGANMAEPMGCRIDLDEPMGGRSQGNASSQSQVTQIQYPITGHVGINIQSDKS